MKWWLAIGHEKFLKRKGSYQLIAIGIRPCDNLGFLDATLIDGAANIGLSVVMRMVTKILE